MKFRMYYVGEGSSGDAWARKNDLARVDLLDLSLNLYWSRVVLSSPALTFDVYAYALGYLAGIAHAVESLPTQDSVELVMDDSGECLNFYRRESWVVVDHEAGSVELPFAELSSAFVRCAGESFDKIYSRYPTLTENRDVRRLERRLAHLPSVLRPRW